VRNIFESIVVDEEIQKLQKAEQKKTHDEIQDLFLR